MKARKSIPTSSNTNDNVLNIDETPNSKAGNVNIDKDDVKAIAEVESSDSNKEKKTDVSDGFDLDTRTSADNSDSSVQLSSLGITSTIKRDQIESQKKVVTAIVATAGDPSLGHVEDSDVQNVSKSSSSGSNDHKKISVKVIEPEEHQVNIPVMRKPVDGPSVESRIDLPAKKQIIEDTAENSKIDITERKEEIDQPNKSDVNPILQHTLNHPKFVKHVQVKLDNKPKSQVATQPKQPGTISVKAELKSKRINSTLSEDITTDAIAKEHARVMKPVPLKNIPANDKSPVPPLQVAPVTVVVKPKDKEQQGKVKPVYKIRPPLALNPSINSKNTDKSAQNVRDESESNKSKETKNKTVENSNINKSNIHIEASPSIDLTKGKPIPPVHPNLNHQLGSPTPKSKSVKSKPRKVAPQKMIPQKPNVSTQNTGTLPPVGSNTENNNNNKLQAILDKSASPKKVEKSTSVHSVQSDKDTLLHEVKEENKHAINIAAIHTRERYVGSDRKIKLAVKFNAHVNLIEHLRCDTIARNAPSKPVNHC